MPGILPMKVIKVGTNASSRIAQACDRCRSKKIRCDGITPCCTQCANIGFECKTSDKLSRRAFPRGYTESLEDRVRTLEAEVKELKDLLDEKDEKIDILSRVRSNTSSIGRPSETRSPFSNHAASTSDSSPVKDDVSQIPPSSSTDSLSSHMPPIGASSGKDFIDAFKSRIERGGKVHAGFSTDSLFRSKWRTQPAHPRSQAVEGAYVPPRMVSDQMINVYLQEWAPLFPILHRTSLLALYSDYVSTLERVHSKHALAHLYLVFGLASLSAEWIQQDAKFFEPVWQSALESIREDRSITTLQCLLLAQLYCIAKADYKALNHYRSTSVALSHQLGLQQTPGNTTLAGLEAETRKKVFWTLYTLDCFTAASLGLPRLLNDANVRVQLPVDVDDEYLSQEGFRQSPPGASTRISNSLALFALSRIVARILDQMYLPTPSLNVVFQRLGDLSDELDRWLHNLPAHLRLRFAQEKPSTSTVGNRSPILSLAYHYARGLLYRPIAGFKNLNKASSAIMSLAQSSKHIVQVVQLLEERRMGFCFCLNRDEVLLLAGFGLLYQTIDLDQKGKLIQDSYRLVCCVISMSERKAAIGAAEFKRVACAMMSVDTVSGNARSKGDGSRRRKSDGTMAAPKAAHRLSTLARASHPAIKQEHAISQPSTTPYPWMEASGLHSDRTSSQHSLSSAFSDPMSRGAYSEQSTSTTGTSQMIAMDPPNLDFFDFNNQAGPGGDYTSGAMGRKPGKMDYRDPQHGSAARVAGGAFVDGVFPSPDVFSPQVSTASPGNLEWGADLWALPNDIYAAQGATHGGPSLSEDGEELGTPDLAGEFSSISMGKQRGLPR